LVVQKREPLESESQCLQDSVEEVQHASKKGAKSKEKVAKGIKELASNEVFRATYKKWKTRLRGAVNTKEDPQETSKRKEDAISSAEKEKLVKSQKKKV
jgi:response regulator of citrate/malate metabolism